MPHPVDELHVGESGVASGEASLLVVEPNLDEAFGRRVGDAFLLLEVRGAACNRTARKGGGAADHRHLFENDHLGALFGCGRGGRHPGAARTDDNDVGRKGFKGQRRRVDPGLSAKRHERDARGDEGFVNFHNGLLLFARGSGRIPRAIR